MYTPTDKLVDLQIAQWSTPDNTGPRLFAPITASDTTIVFTATPYYYDATTGVKTAITGDCLIGIEGTGGYVETVYAPAGSISGTTLTGAVRGIRLDGLDYTTGDSTLAVAHEGDASVIFNITAIHWRMMVNAFMGNIASGGTQWKVGRGLAEDILFRAYNDQTSKPVFYFDDSDKRWKITRGDDEGTAGESELSGFMRLTTAERNALTNLPAGGVAIYNTTLGQTEWREGGAWVTNASGGTVADASETVAGKIELATNAEMRLGTSTGGTGARLIPPNDQLVASSAGAADQGKIATLNSTGDFSSTFMPSNLEAAASTGTTNITGTELETLSAGSTSDATALHRHGSVSEAGEGSNGGITASGNLDINLNTLTSSNVIKLDITIFITAINDDTSDQSRSSYFHIHGIYGDDFAGLMLTTTAASLTPPVVWTVNPSTMYSGNGSISAVAASSGTGATSLAVAAPVMSGNNLRFAYTYSKTGGTGTGASAAGLYVGVCATKVN